MIQEIFPHQFSNHYHANASIKENDFIIHFNENSLLLKLNDNKFEIPRKKNFSNILDKTEYTFLFTLNNVSCFLIWDDLNDDKSHFIYKDISFFRTICQQEIAWISIVGFHLKNWYLQNKFCGTCGAKTQHKSDERALICPNCNTIVFPKISPAVIVAIICKNKILLARNSKFTHNWFSLIAGFVDIGESLEQALIREVKEEVGLKIKNIRYYKSQPWPLSGSMMIGFIAEADENQPILVDGVEIEEAIWFSRENLPKYPPKRSIAGEMIEKFKNGQLYY